MGGWQRWAAYFPWGTGFQGSGVAHPTETGTLAGMPVVPGGAPEPVSHPGLRSTGPLEGRR